MISFAHLHVHSAFSPNWGIHSPAILCAAAKSAGMTHLALTDRNGIYGIPRFLEEAKKAGIAPLIGAEAVRGTQRAVLLAGNRNGYANLCRLLSTLHDRNPCDLSEALAACRDGLYILSDDAGVLNRLAKQSREGLYVEVSPGHHMERALALARSLKLPPVATTRAVYLREEDIETHRVLRVPSPEIPP